MVAAQKSCYILWAGSGVSSQHSPRSISNHRDGYLGSAVYRSALSGATFLLQGISQLLNIDWLTYLAFQILGQQFETWSVDVFLVWCSATVLLMSHGKVKLFGIIVMALAVSAEIYSYVVRYFGSGTVSPLLKLVLLSCRLCGSSWKAARRSRFLKEQKKPELSSPAGWASGLITSHRRMSAAPLEDRRASCLPVRVRDACVLRWGIPRPPDHPRRRPSPSPLW